MSASVIFAQETSRQSPLPDYTFDVIIGLSSKGEENTVKAIRKLIATSNPGLTYLGFCKSQHCIILKAKVPAFDSRDQVTSFLKTKYGQRILGFKDYSIQDFYKQCEFSSAAEYKFFKTTYR